jgi:hypothetical protein
VKTLGCLSFLSIHMTVIAIEILLEFCFIKKMLSLKLSQSLMLFCDFGYLWLFVYLALLSSDLHAFYFTFDSNKSFLHTKS